MQTKVGTHDAKHGKHQVTHQFMRQTNGDLHQRDKQWCFTQQIGNHQIDTHLLEQRENQIDLADHEKSTLLRMQWVHA